MRSHQASAMASTIRPKLANSEDSLITREQAARLLSVHIRTVDRLARQGKFRTYYLGCLVRFLKSEVIAAWESPQI